MFSKLLDEVSQYRYSEHLAILNKKAREEIMEMSKKKATPPGTKMPEFVTCKFIKPDGVRCGAKPAAGSEYCINVHHTAEKDVRQPGAVVTVQVQEATPEVPPPFPAPPMPAAAPSVEPGNPGVSIPATSEIPLPFPIPPSPLASTLPAPTVSSGIPIIGPTNPLPTTSTPPPPPTEKRKPGRPPGSKSKTIPPQATVQTASYGAAPSPGLLPAFSRMALRHTEFIPMLTNLEQELYFDAQASRNTEVPSSNPAEFRNLAEELEDLRLCVGSVIEALMLVQLHVRKIQP